MSFRWQTTPEDFAVERALARWRGTPWRDAISVGVPGEKGQANCWTFVSGVLCDLEGKDPIILPAMHAQALIHNRGDVAEAMKLFFENFQHSTIDVGEFAIIYAGDVLIDEDGHALLADTKPNVVWHTDRNTSVCTASVMDFSIRRIYRLSTRSQWC